MEAVKQPVCEINYQGHDLIALAGDNICSVTYTDFAHAKADSLEIEIEDGGGDWKNGWYPKKGDQISFRFGFKSSKCDWLQFEVDEIEFKSAPETVVIKSLTAALKSNFKEKRTRAWENIRFEQICAEIAKNQKIKSYYLSDRQDPLSFTRLDQKEESDMAFLKRICELYGFHLKLSPNRLSVLSIDSLESAAALNRFEKQELTRYRIRDTSAGVYQSCSVEYWDQNEGDGALVSYTAEDTSVNEGGALTIRERAENEVQARLRAEAALKAKNRKRITGSIELEGDPGLYANGVIELAELFKLSGNYFSTEIKHTITDNGYQAMLEIYKIA